MRALLGAVAWLAASVAGAATSTNALDRYIGDLTTWSADFRQVVVDTSGKQLGDGQGRLFISRPGKFRWESAPAGATAGAQLLVADGTNLWFLDRDLQQATVRPQEQALAQSPAMLLAGGADLSVAFEQRDLGASDGFDWVEVKPRDARSDFREARFAFRGGKLERLIVLDRLGQRSELRFTGVVKNRPVDAALFRFQLPAGVDLIGQPRHP